MTVAEFMRAPQLPNGEILRRLLRGLISLVVTLVLVDLVWRHIPTTLHGKTDVVGYPLFANFNINRYLDAFYLTALIGPAMFIVAYSLLSRFGPLRRLAPRRHGSLRSAATDDKKDTGEQSATRSTVAFSGVAEVLRLFFVGAIAALEVVTAHPFSRSPLLVITISGLSYVALILVISNAKALVSPGGSSWITTASHINSLVIIATVALCYPISRATEVYIVSTRQVVHYPWLPLWLVIAVTSLLVVHTVRRWRSDTDSTTRVEQNLLYFVAIPITIFILAAQIPGALGGMDTFGEGEFLAGGWLLMHGVVPWRDLYLIHGVFDDGIKGIVGFQIFGRTRWGATAGMTMLLIPLYWVATYYFAAVVFRRRPLFVLGVFASIALGVFVDWDLRYLFWPLILVLLYWVLERRTPARTAALVAGLIVEAIFIPELSYALLAVGVTLVAYEVYMRDHALPTPHDFRATLWSIVTTIVIGGAFLVWLIFEHALGGFIGYFRDFATAHSLTGGIPLYTTYTVATLPNALGITLHATASPPMMTRYGLELVIPVAAIVATFCLVTVRVRGGRRLVTHDWLSIAAALLVALYYQKGISRADSGHIAEVFEVTVPLLLLLAYRLVTGIENAVLRACTRLKNTRHSIKASRWQARVGVTPVSFFALIAVLVLAPVGAGALINNTPGHIRASSPLPAPPSPVRGGPGLGYNVGALPVGVVTDIARVFERYAGTDGPVFDFSNAPAIVYFLLNRRPVSRFYDVGNIVTPLSERNAISDLERSRPNVVLFRSIGMGAWDFIPNEIRDGILSDWLLTHYRPLVMVNGQLLLIRDSITHVAPLPRLIGPVRTRSFYYRLGKCAWGYIPNFLNLKSSMNATPLATVSLTLIKTNATGRFYRFIAPGQLGAFHWISVTVSGTHKDVGLAVSDLSRVSSRDISWAAMGSGTTEVEVASCLQWHGFGRVLYLRYLGPGTPSAVTLTG